MVWGDLSTGFHSKDMYPNKPNPEYKESAGRDWGNGGTLYGLLNEFPPPQHWWWASCDRGHDAVVVLERLREDVRAKKPSHMTSPVRTNDEGYPTLV